MTGFKIQCICMNKTPIKASEQNMKKYCESPHILLN